MKYRWRTHTHTHFPLTLAQQPSHKYGAPTNRPVRSAVNRNVSPSFYSIKHQKKGFLYTQWYRDTDGYHACMDMEKYRCNVKSWWRKQRCHLICYASSVCLILSAQLMVACCWVCGRCWVGGCEQDVSLFPFGASRSVFRQILNAATCSLDLRCM